MSSQQVASHACFLGELVFHPSHKGEGVVGRDKKRGPLNTSAWEATQQAIVT